MPSKSKAKGNRFERQIVQDIEGKGLKAKRAWGSYGEALGMHAEVDLVFYGQEDNEYRVQAKCRKKIADFLLPTEHVDAVVFKQDRGETLILMRFEDFLDPQNYIPDLEMEANNE